MDDLRVEYVIPHFTLATLFVNNPGNLSDPKRLAHLNSFVEEMEHLPGAWGADSSNYFVRLNLTHFLHKIRAIQRFPGIRKNGERRGE